MGAMLSLDRKEARYRRALRQIRFDLESSAVPSDLRKRLYQLIDDALAGVSDRNPSSGKVHR